MSRGVIYMLGATFLFSLMNMFVKMVPGIPAVEVVFFRSVISLVISLSILLYQGVKPFGTNRKLLFLRGFFGAIALTLYFYTLQRIPLATAVTLQFTAPIFTVLVGLFLVKEKVYRWQWAFLALSFVGILVIKQFDQRISWFFVFAGITASFFAALAYNMIRMIKTSEHPLVIIIYFPLVTAPLTGIYSATRWVMPEGSQWWILLSIGILTQAAQYFLTKAYQTEELSKVASMKYLGIVFALFYGYVFFDETFNLLTYLGMGLVLIGVLINLIYKKRKDDKVLKQLKKEMKDA